MIYGKCSNVTVVKTYFEGLSALGIPASEFRTPKERALARQILAAVIYGRRLMVWNSNADVCIVILPS